MGRYDALYARLPITAQHGAVSAYGLYWHWLRFGPGYQRSLREYLSRDRLDGSAWVEWQRQRLRELLSIAAVHVPFYRSTWDQTAKAAASEGRLDVLPLLEKEPLRQDAYAFLRDDIKPRRLVFHTSGSTGTPIASIWTVKELRNSLALREARSARWAGVSFELPRATFSGRTVEPAADSRGPFYRFNIVERQAYFSAFHLRPDTARHYVKAMKTHRIQWMTGYAFSYYTLARFILEQQLEVPPLKAVVTTSEKLTADMRTVMEQAYKCRVFEEYSTVENVLFASECEAGSLHVSPDAGVVEILRSDGTACPPGEVGEVVATCLMRDYQPLIRFRLGDLARWDDRPCACGRAMPLLLEVTGRIEDAVVGPDGREMVRFHGIFVEQPNVIEGQIIQEELRRIRVKVVTTSGFASADTQEIIRRVQQRLGSQVDVIVEPVTNIARTKAGKFQAVVSLLQRN
jgi:phenylacetate-coenzyme A ligase PaaK-like adenylate-forming protein